MDNGDKSIYMEFLGLEQDLRERVRQYLDPLGVNHMCFMYLLYIGSHRGCKVSEVADALRMDKASVTRSLSGLGRLGYIDRQIGKLDTRAFDLYLTPAGKAIVRAVEKLVQDWEDDIRAALTDEGYDTLADLLHRARERFVADRAKTAAQTVLRRGPAFFH